MREKITVVGAGMAGLLAAAMLRSDCAQVLEINKSLPNNHSALLRFRSNIVGDTLGIEFKRVRVIKAIVPWKNQVADALAYSFKANGNFTIRSSVTATGEIEERFIAPDNLIERMAEHVQAPIRFGAAFGVEKVEGPVISTMPMPALVNLLKWKGINDGWPSVDGYNINVNLRGVDAYCTLYVPSPDYPFSRVSLTGNRLTIEFPNVKAPPSAMYEIQRALALLGMPLSVSYNLKDEDYVAKQQQYAKILPIDDDARKQFIIWASQTHNIYSLGRFATWRSNLLLDDVVNDVRVIQRLVNKGHYDKMKGFTS